MNFLKVLQLTGQSRLLIERDLKTKSKCLSKLFFYKTLPHLCLEGLEKYFRVEIEGIENLPLSGKAILIPNHSGYMGLDALILQSWIFRNKKRIPRIFLHKFWFTGNLLKTHAERFGFVKANYLQGVRSLQKNNMLILFPEGERGNFKPFNERYQLQKFKTGFVRMAFETNAPVVPIIIIGAEESHINVGQLSIMGQLLPIPLNIVPLPAKWKIKILKPIALSEFSNTNERNDFEYDEIAKSVKTTMQQTLNLELAQRKFIYFDPQNQK